MSPLVVGRRLCLPLLLLTAEAAFGGPATRVPLALQKTAYVSRAGGTVRIEIAGPPLIARVLGLKSMATPQAAAAPFAAVNLEGDFVIAVPAATPPGHFTVAFDIAEPGRVRTGTISVAVQAPAQVPAGSGTPVIFLNGYQPPNLFQFSTCPTEAPDGSQPFGTIPKSLPTFTVFFDNCVECPNCSIEELGTHLGQRIAGLTYTDGTPVTQVDVVAHSMGGLIVRAYLTGKAPTGAVFSPPADPKIRKAVFIGTPHFGTFLATTLDTQSIELRPGSQFLWDLSRWNQGTDDLREVDAIAIAGNGALTGKSDGVVELTSPTLMFAGRPDVRTRVINACHIDGATAFLVLCGTSQGIASSSESQQIVSSFLEGSDTWTNVGHAPSQDPFLSRTAGLFAAVYDNSDVPQNNVSGMSFSGQAMNRNSENQVVFYSDSLVAGSGTLSYNWQGRENQTPLTVRPGGSASVLLKAGPEMLAVTPAAGAIATLNIAPGSLISIYGTALANGTATASSFPWPTQLADVTLNANGQPVPLLYAGPGQINAYFPPALTGLVTLTLANSLGQHSINVMTTNASPALFSADRSGGGIAAAIHAATGQPVTVADPAVAGEYIELYGTGFGSTYTADGYQVTSLVPLLSVGGIPAEVSFSGIPTGGVGLYQLNFIVPGGLASGEAQIQLVMGSYTANSVTLPCR